MKKIVLSITMLMCVALGYSQQEASSSRTAPKQTTAAKPVNSDRTATKDANTATSARKVQATPASNNNTTTPAREAVNDPNAATNKRIAPKQ